MTQNSPLPSRGEGQGEGWGSRRCAAVATCALLALTACSSKPAKHIVTDLQAVGPTLADNGLLGMNSAQVEAELRKTLDSTGHFAFLEPGKKPDKKDVAASLSLELPFTRESKKEGRDGTFAEV